MCCASSKTRPGQENGASEVRHCISRLHQQPVEAAHRRTHLSILILHLHKVPTSNFMLSPAIFAQDFSCFQKLKTHFLLLFTSTARACRKTALRTICISGCVVSISGNIAVSQHFRLKLTRNRFFCVSEEPWAGLLRREAPVSLSGNSLTAALAE